MQRPKVQSTVPLLSKNKHNTGDYWAINTVKTAEFCSSVWSPELHAQLASESRAGFLATDNKVALTGRKGASWMGSGRSAGLEK